MSAQPAVRTSQYFLVSVKKGRWSVLQQQVNGTYKLGNYLRGCYEIAVILLWLVGAANIILQIKPH
ncbi:hypothetical protein D3H65_10030 [Paraflavitalea soli]|uniref:Uncharacterized protein n=1 Tax=Paraflavitalea soli TaxID=2315862 RepID=A0A3B7MIR4_9BACT|nr:hypothetical protein D3H65_10030 [Paraflavitalea soli]